MFWRAVKLSDDNVGPYIYVRPQNFSTEWKLGSIEHACPTRLLQSLQGQKNQISEKPFPPSKYPNPTVIMGLHISLRFNQLDQISDAI